jgi:3-oxoacyl-[acyl-carrier protein] reductase
MSTTRRALVTGASRGIGAAVAKRLAADGFSVLVNYRTQVDAARAVCDDIRKAGGEASLCPFDVTQAPAVDSALAAALEDGPISVLVNNAGVTADASFPAMRPEQWAAVIKTSLDGFYNVTRPLVMPMVRQRYGRIITMSSVAGIAGNRGQVNYAAAKAGLIGATKALALELAKRKITVNAVAPGLIETDMLSQMSDATREHMIKTQIPARRLGTVDEVAHVVSFLAGEQASYITGQVIRVDGGLL